MRLLLLTLTLLAGCTRHPDAVREAGEGAAAPLQAPAEPARTAPPTPPSPADAGCAPEPTAALCAAQGRQCGRLLVTDRCGEARQLSCGGCAQGATCTASGRCEAACPRGQQRCCDGQCDAPEACAVLVCDPRPAPPDR